MVEDRIRRLNERLHPRATDGPDTSNADSPMRMLEPIDTEPYAGTTKSDLFGRYQTAKAERDEARALVRGLVEAGENIVHEVCEGWCQRTPSHRRFDDCFGCTIEQRMIAKARDADYTEEGE